MSEESAEDKLQSIVKIALALLHFYHRMDNDELIKVAELIGKSKAKSPFEALEHIGDGVSAAHRFISGSQSWDDMETKIAQFKCDLASLKRLQAYFIQAAEANLIQTG